MMLLTDWLPTIVVATSAFSFTSSMYETTHVALITDTPCGMWDDTLILSLAYTTLAALLTDAAGRTGVPSELILIYNVW
jgi:hypothetical protein